MIPIPPHLADLPAGYVLRAGMGTATVLPDADFETYSAAGYIWNHSKQKWDGPPGAPASKKGLNVVGVAVYATHPTTEILSLAYNLKDGLGARLWKPGDAPPQELFDHFARGGLIEAWNSGFEHWIWNHVAVPKLGWPPLPLRQLRCAMAKARAHALPGGLGDVGDVMNLALAKDADGKRLLNKFSVPQKPTKKEPRTRIRPQDDPADAAKLYAYNVRDIEAEGEASSRTPDLSADELELWLCDQEINYRGVAVDVPAIENCIAIVEQVFERYNGELKALTGGVVEKASQHERLKNWLHAQGCYLSSTDQEHVEDALTWPSLTPAARRALELRALTGSASIKKLFAMKNQVTAGRLHDLFVYHAGRTGRAAGQGPQPQNLPKAGPDVFKCPACSKYSTVSPACPWCGVMHWSPPVPWEKAGKYAIEDALEIIAVRNLDLVEMFWGDAFEIIIGCLRGLFIAADGHDLIASDYSAIEAVVTAALAGEEWRLEVFRTHGKIYETSASKITGVPFQEFLAYRERTGNHHPLRAKIGKFAELACGFGGWIGAWVSFGADEYLTEDEIKDAIIKWRNESPAIVELWGGQGRGWPGNRNYRREYFGLEGAATQAVLNPGVAFSYCAPHPDARPITYQVQGDILYCTLPSGRRLTYHHPRLHMSDRREGELSLSFMGWNTNPKMGAPGWVQMWTYGGKLTENVVQAVARDILAYAIINLRKAGYPVVLHVHDEIVAEVIKAFGSVEEFERIMSTLAAWCASWPIKAKGGWRGRRFRKD